MTQKQKIAGLISGLLTLIVTRIGWVIGGEPIFFYGATVLLVGMLAGFVMGFYLTDKPISRGVSPVRKWEDRQSIHKGGSNGYFQDREGSV